MDSFIIKGGSPLNGSINISGSKNAALPLMAAAMLAEGKTVIRNIPRLQDIYTFNNVLRVTGAQVDFDDTHNTLHIDPSNVNFTEAPYDLVRKMRASFYMLGALVGRHRQAKVSLPGGCAWGPRPVDLHLKGMEAMRIKITLEEGYVLAEAEESLSGKEFTLNPSSVGATVNILLAGVLRAEEFTLRNAAIEPDVVQLCNVLSHMGANIEGIGTQTLTIRKADKLVAKEIRNDPDRIEMGTYMIAAAMNPGSELEITGGNPDHLGSFLKEFEKTGALLDFNGPVVKVTAPDELKPVSIETAIYPGFPTDLQAQWSTMMTQATGQSTVTDTVYFDRFSYVPELVRLGANLRNEQNSVHISGKTPLKGASIMSTDLRASVSLVMAGLIASGSTQVLRIYHLDRGYEELEQKLNAIGASVERVKE